MSALKNIPAASAVVLAVSLLAGVRPEARRRRAGRPGGGMPPAEVGVITVATQSIGLATELPGRLEASRVAQVRARAAGILQKRLFTEGSEVKAGQVLFTIDAAPYQATAASARAALARAEANLTQATALAERYKPLMEANAISKQEYINAVAAQKTAQADVATGRATVQTAQINLGYATVTAPISGRIGRALVTEGALVGAGEATPLATIQQINPMYVNFTQSTTDVLRLRRAVESGKFKRSGTDGAEVRVLLEDGSDYGQTGKLLFSDLTVDPTTGQITLRAQVPNPTGLAAARHVRARAARGGAGRGRHRRAAAGGHARHQRRQRDGRRRRRQGRAAAGQGRCRGQRPVGRARRPEGRRAGDGRRLPEAARQRAGQAGAVEAGGVRCGSRLAPHPPWPRPHRPPAHPPPRRPSKKGHGTWPSSSSIARSSRG